LGGLFDDFDLIGGEGVEAVDEGVDFFIGGGDLALEGFLVGGGLGGGEGLVEGEHLGDEGDEAVVGGFVFFVGEVNGADGEGGSS
jgi:hypothetical protein